MSIGGAFSKIIVSFEKNISSEKKNTYTFIFVWFLTLFPGVWPRGATGIKIYSDPVEKR